MSLGTNWVAPNEGSTYRELLNWINAWMEAIPGVGNSPVVRDAIYRIGKRSSASPLKLDGCSNLALTGQPLQPYDLERIAHLE